MSAHRKSWARHQHPLDETTGHHHLENLPIASRSLIRLIRLLLLSIESNAVSAVAGVAGGKPSILVKCRYRPPSKPASSWIALGSCKPCSPESIETTHYLPSHSLCWTPWMCFEFNRIAHTLSPCCPSFEEPAVFSTEGRIEGFDTEYYQRGPKRKQILLWQCCQCGQGGNPIRHDNCYNCHYPRCAYCPVRKVRA
ncbi:hypothetical protein CCHR01_08723 [Colletotrichum chrysophilum]|uniref:Uncharacterized protein n=1 Tax=Colletotrichum chrysophilum TaxID=1836956 RepID=A0AAD9AJT0_9PEZI|nr:hypothetical protein CCHR01_08723 [Colletotrichum chrysophilum]